MTVQADINRQDHFKEIGAPILDDTAPTRVACQGNSEGRTATIKIAQEWAEKR